jgi:purine nucleosidase
MIGLDVTHLALYTPQVAQRLGSIDSASARWTAELLDFFTSSYRVGGHMDAPPVHDAVAVACVIEPSLVPVQDARVQVETAGRLTSGMTVVDFGPAAATSDAPPMAERRHHVGVGLEVERFWDLVLGAIGSLRP